MLKLMNEFAAPPQFYSSDNTSVPEKVQALQVQLVENKWVLIWEFDNLQIDAASYKELFYIVGNYLSELRKIVKNFENQLLVTVSKNKATKEFLDKIGFFTLHISSDNDISQLFDKLKTTFSQPSSDFPGSTDKKLCKYCNEEIDQESFVIHVVRCKILKKKKADEAVTCSAKKPKLN
ncbi:unnamed protein product [Meloidogyne enterolobii]|uniref:Uncharacterized protein n=1 Tax=Meloidogyne enterolobii TaxID=390850 RepID=A0ACB0ZPW2_MELEN